MKLVKIINTIKNKLLGYKVEFKDISKGDLEALHYILSVLKIVLKYGGNGLYYCRIRESQKRRLGDLASYFRDDKKKLLDKINSLEDEFSKFTKASNEAINHYLGDLEFIKGLFESGKAELHEDKTELHELERLDKI